MTSSPGAETTSKRPGTPGKVAHACGNRLEWQVHRHRGRRRRQDVVDVRTPDQPRFDRDRASGRADLERETGQRELERPGRDVGVAGDRECDRFAANVDQRRAAGIVEVDRAGCVGGQHLEESALREEVVLHVLVKVEMVAREVREDPGREPHAVDAFERQGV